jgi:hypothetical protein
MSRGALWFVHVPGYKKGFIRAALTLSIKMIYEIPEVSVSWFALFYETAGRATHKNSITCPAQRICYDRRIPK